MSPNVLGDGIVRPSGEYHACPHALRILMLVRYSSQPVGLPINEHGDLRVREHFDRLAAEDNRRDTATPVRGHHDQIALSRLGGFDNRSIDLFMLDVKGVADDTC